MPQTKNHYPLLLLLFVMGLTLVWVNQLASAAITTRPSTRTTVNDTTAFVPFVIDCEGDACNQVTLSWD